MRDDFTDDVARWMPDEGEYELEVVKMEAGESKAGNPKYTINFADAGNPQNGLIQDLTNIQGKRWLLRQLIEACGIELEKDEEGKTIYDWEISDIEGKTVLAKIVHEKSSFIDRSGNERETTKPKIMAFKKFEV